MHTPTPLVPDSRFTADEIAAIRAYEAIQDGLAVPRRGDPTYFLLMQTACAKGYDALRGRKFKPTINLFD